MNSSSDPKLLVLGGEGMLGHKLFQVLSRRYAKTKCTVSGSLDDPFYRPIRLFSPETAIERVDAMDFPALRRMLEREKPDFIVNGIGIIKQRQLTRSPIPSLTINSLLPHLLAEWAVAWGGRLVHFSTDCVFSGKKGNYSEDDAADAEDLYGRSKFLGEAAEANALTLRTSIIGRELRYFTSLLEWFRVQRGRQVKGFRKVIYSGVTTKYIAELVGKIISDHPGLSGLYQVAAPAISKHDLLVRLRAAYGLDIEIVPDDSEVSDRSMNGERFRKATGYPEPSWDALIRELAEDPTPYSEWGLR